nr:hypothetical protein [Tanacetum cinerariifolium]
VVLVIPEPVLVDEDEDPEEEEFEEEEEPQEEEEDMDIYDEEDENELMEEGAVAMENLVRKLERPNEAIEVPVEDEESPSSEPLDAIGCHDLYHFVTQCNYSAHLTQAAIRRMIKESFNAAIAAERARHANAGNNASGSGPARGAVELRRWFEKMEMTFGISECAKDKKVKFAAATLRGPALTLLASNYIINLGLYLIYVVIG